MGIKIIYIYTYIVYMLYIYTYMLLLPILLCQRLSFQSVFIKLQSIQSKVKKHVT